MSGGPGLLALAFGLVMGATAFALPGWIRERARRDHDGRRAARMARGTDAYFEELRALEAYRPARSLLLWRLGGGAIFLSCAFLLVRRFAN